MKKIFFLLLLPVFICQRTISQNVGIWTTTPKAPFNVAENKTVLFGLDTNNVGNKFIWYPTKGALRFGEINSIFDPNAWHYANIGVNSLAFGANTRATGPQSIASGVSTTASGGYAWAHGFATYAYGHHSIAIGQNTGAEGESSFAFGNGARAFGNYSQAIGNNNVASGVFSTALGSDTYAKSYSSLVIGRYNDSIATSSNTSWVSTDPLFIIGNGSSTMSRTNAMVVLKNGVTGIGLNPTGNLVSWGMLQTQSIGSKHNLTLVNGAGTNRWGFYVTTNLNLYFNGVFKGAFNDVDGVYTAISDRRYKKNIQPISSVLDEVLHLTPYQYHFIDNKQDDPLSHGFIAQEVEKIFPGYVTYLTDRDGNKMLGLNYDKFTVLAIKAIQEQHEIISTQQKKIDDLEKRLQTIESKLK